MSGVVDRLGFFDDQRQDENPNQRPTFRTGFTRQDRNHFADDENQQQAFHYRIADAQDRMPRVKVSAAGIDDRLLDRALAVLELQLHLGQVNLPCNSRADTWDQVMPLAHLRRLTFFRSDGNSTFSFFEFPRLDVIEALVLAGLIFNFSTRPKSGDLRLRDVAVEPARRRLRLKFIVVGKCKILLLVRTKTHRFK